tara:strand:- start:2728 stop:3156 length:429 start_codon:yes stop_codon:yes gene_type:complete
MTPYQVLGLDEGASPEEIKKAWRAKAKETHPDKHPGDDQAGERFKAVQEAYETLSAPKEPEPDLPKCPRCASPTHREGETCNACVQYVANMRAMDAQQNSIRKRLREEAVACYRVSQQGLERKFGWLGDWNRRGVPKWWDVK